MTIETSTQIRIQKHEDFWYTVEDTHLDVGCEGCTISYWYINKNLDHKRESYICMGEDEALNLADAIYKLFKKN
jgi:hypothetical protein